MNKLWKIVLVTPTVLQMGLFATTSSAQNNEVQFEYDARGRLIQMTNNTGQEVLYTLDDAGNRTAATIYLSQAASASLIAPQTQSQPEDQPAIPALTQDAKLKAGGYTEVKGDE